MSEKNGGVPFPGCLFCTLLAVPMLVWSLIRHPLEVWRYSAGADR